MYTFDSRVRYSEVGEDARITVNAIIDYMQDCTNFQSEDLGVGLEYHKKKQLMWVLNSWQIVIEKYPDRKSTRLNSSHSRKSRMPSSA